MRISGENLQLSVNNLNVNYDDNGPVFAPAVVFIHGTPFNKSVWDLQTESLKSNYRVITYDLRGHGKTTGDESAPLTIDTFTDDLIRFLDALELEKVMLCGSSLGGYIALNAIETHPERFNALVLTATQCGQDSAETKAERNRVLALLQTYGMEKYCDEMIADLFAPTSFTTRKEEVRSVIRMITETSPLSIINTMNALTVRRETCSNLWSISVPVLIMVGKEDMLTPVDVAQFMRDNISGSVMHIIDYAGHLVNLENTHEYNSILKQFIEKVCQKKQLSRHCTDTAKAEKKNAVSKSH